MKQAILLFYLILCFTVTTVAQDRLYKKDKSVIEGKVTEIGLNEVKYKDPALKDGPLISISVDDLIKIELSSGRIIEFKNPLTDPSSYVDDKKKALKFHFLSPLLEHLSFSYEKVIKPGRSFESSISLIGIGFDSDEDSKSVGIGIGAGVKFMRTPDFYQQKMKYAHILKGSYVKPEVLLSVYNNDYGSYYFNSAGGSTYRIDDKNIVAGAFIINIGKQIVYDNFFLLDYSFGIGYGFTSEDNNYLVDGSGSSYRINHFGYIIGGDITPIALSAKLKVGILLN